VEWITRARRKKRTSKKNMDGRSTSSRDNREFRTRSMEKQRGMAFGFRKTVTAVKKPDGWMAGWMNRWTDGWMGGWMDGWVDRWMDGWMGGWVDGRMDG
jgi:hypothetical protein